MGSPCSPQTAISCRNWDSFPTVLALSRVCGEGSRASLFPHAFFSEVFLLQAFLPSAFLLMLVVDLVAHLVAGLVVRLVEDLVKGWL